MSDTKLLVTDIQRFCTQDGPGIRTVVFLKGCPLRCVWCHNPETQAAKTELFYDKKLCIHCGACAACCPANAHAFDGDGTHAFAREGCQLCMRCVSACPSGALEAAGEYMDIGSILQTVEKDRVFYENTGGLTLSGGEPFFQKQGAVALLSAAKERGFTTAVETSGYFDGAVLAQLVGIADLLLWDIKDCNDERHKRNTGVSNAPILENLKRADALGLRTQIRCIVVAGVNTDEENYAKLAELYHGLRHCDGVKLLPYHTYGSTKNVLLGKQENANRDWIPSAEKLKEIENYLRSKKVPVL